MRKRHIIMYLVAGALLITALGVGIYNHCKNPSFWDVNVAQILTLFITIAIAFWATQFKNDQRRAKDHVERVIIKIQNLVVAEQFYSFDPNGDVENGKKLYGISTRKVTNCIEVLKSYGASFGFEADIEYIEKELTNYKVLVSEHINDFDYLSKSESQLRRHSENIDSKCDQIIVKLYK